MEREELLESKEYWVAKIQIALFELIENYMAENDLTRTQLAEKLGVTKGYITQILNGDYDHKISKLVELSLACGIAPVFNFINLPDYIANESNNKARLSKPKKSMIPKQVKKLTSKPASKRKLRA